METMGMQEDELSYNTTTTVDFKAFWQCIQMVSMFSHFHSPASTPHFFTLFPLRKHFKRKCFRYEIRAFFPYCSGTFLTS